MTLKCAKKSVTLKNAHTKDQLKNV